MEERIRHSIENKLWHQCTILILQYLTTSVSSSSSTNESWQELYTTIIAPIQTKIHPLAYARMVVLIATTTTTNDASLLLMTEAYRLLKDQQQQALILLNGGGGGSSSSSNSNSNNTNSIDYGTPTSYVEALLYLQCHQAIYTMTRSSTSSSSSSSTATAAERKQFLQKNIYHKIIQPNATLIQDLISMTTTTTPKHSSSSSTTSTTTAEETLPSAASLYDSTMVYSAYYQMTMMYDHFVTPFTAKYYHHAIQYLQYSNNNNINNIVQNKDSAVLQDNMTLAIQLCWSAILGEGIYNLSYLIEHPFIVAVRAHCRIYLTDAMTLGGNSVMMVQQFQFVDQLLSAIEACQYPQYQQLLAQATTMTTTESSSSSVVLLVPTLSETLDQTTVVHMIREKFTLITLLHVITTTTTTNTTAMTEEDDDDDHHNHPATNATTSDRTFTFEDLKVALHLNDHDNNHDSNQMSTDDDNKDNDPLLLDLEMILMRAISIGLIQGTIDEILQTVTITYIQPLTTLTQSQLSQLLQQYQHWTTNLQHHITTLQKEAITTK